MARLAKGALVHTTWQESPVGPPRKYYALTDAGRTRLIDMAAAYRAVSHDLTDLLKDPTPMTIRSLDELSAAARKAADEALDAALAAAPARLRGSLRDDLTGLSVRWLISGRRPATAPTCSRSPRRWPPRAARRGRGSTGPAPFVPKGMLGRIAATWWNADERLLLPRAVGWGWDSTWARSRYDWA